MVAESPRNAASPSPDTASGESEKKTLRAFLERPNVSIRTRIAVAFLLMFALLSGVTGAATLFISQSNVKLQFLERIGNYRAELQQARRFEKDFFLYGTNLPDALANIQMARNHLERSADDIESVVGGETYFDMKASVTQYESLLERLSEASAGEEPGKGNHKREIEILLRRHGAKILADADEMIDRERMELYSMLRTSMLAAVGFLIFMLFVMAYIAGFLIRSVLRPLGRFVQYAGRIGAGDYSPIVPARKYRDEFSNLAIAINQMLSDLVLRQEQLTQSGKMAAIGTLTSGIAHELNNPLNNIGITTEALIEGFTDYTDEQRLKMLDQIYTQVERASGTVRNLLDFTRREQSVFTSVSILEILNSTARLVGNELKLGGIELSLDLDDKLPEIKGNPRNLQQVFLNLFLNAIQAMPQGGRLGVRTLRAEDDFLRVDVSDTGLGIPAEDLDKVFEPFFTTKEPGKGTGLGLSVAYATVEAHHGRITVASNRGKGTTFSVFLPLGTNASNQQLQVN
jgi:two-component system NtrC family sensor kinase